MRIPAVLGSMGGLIVMLCACAPATSAGQPAGTASGGMPSIHYVAGAPATFATHAELLGYGFAWGPSDGEFGAIPAGGGSYTFYGTGGSKRSCGGVQTGNGEGVFTFSGTLERVTGGNGCARLFGPGDGPAGWLFDKDYAGGGQVVRFTGQGKTVWLMPFHGEYHWKNTNNPPSEECTTGPNTTSLVPCFYSGVGLAVSMDNGKTFKVVGQIVQPSEPLSNFEGSANNMDVGYGSLIVADANGRHLDNPPPDPRAAYVYVFFADRLSGLPGTCANTNCMAVARAPYADVVAAALSGDAHQVAKVFHKYDGASPDPWTQPATSDTPDQSGTSGKFAPLWTDTGAFEPEVIYDKSFDAYLAVYPYGGGANIRASSDLIHWSAPIGDRITEAGQLLAYPTLIGETGDPTVAGAAQRLYFSSFPTNAFPDYSQSVFESLQLTLSKGS